MAKRPNNHRILHSKKNRYVKLSVAMLCAALLATVLIEGDANAQAAQPTGVVTPIATCREVRPDGQYIWFGYFSDNATTITIPISPSANKITPAPQDRGQPTTFESGSVPRAILVFLGNNGNHNWHLRSPNGVTIMATGTLSTPLCPPMPPVDGPPELAGRCAGPYAILGTTGNDQLAGTPGPDVICGFGGDDVILGLGGDDLVLAGAGNDYVIGGDGKDRIDGGPGDDSLTGGADGDTLSGADGVDTIAGNEGEDALDGGPADDLLVAGAEADRSDGGLGTDKCTEAETVANCEEPTSFDDDLPPLTFHANAPNDSRIGVDAVAPARVPEQRLLVSVNPAWTFSSKFVATATVDVSFSSGAQPVSAFVTLPTVAPVSVDEPLTVATVDPVSQLLVPVDTPIQRLPGALRFAVPHFSSYLVIRGRATAGEWSSTILDALYGDFPAKCAPLGSAGSSKRTAFVVSVDTSGSLLEAEAQFPVNITDVRRQWLSRIRLNTIDSLSVTTFDGDVWPVALAPVIGFDSYLNQKSRSEQQLGQVVLPSFGDSNIRAAFRDGIDRLTATTATQRAMILVTDDEAAQELNADDSTLLQTAGVYLFLIRVGPVGSLTPSPIGSSRFVTEYRATGATDQSLATLRSDITKLEESLASDSDTDRDGLSDCEEDNGYFVTGPIRARNGDPFAITVNGAVGRVIYSKSGEPDSDGDLRIDGDELVRIGLDSNAVLAKAFKPLYDKGFRNVYRPFTGLPNRRDTDGDGLPDAGPGAIPIAVAKVGRTEPCNDQWTNPLDWDSQGTGLGDSVANCTLTSQKSGTNVSNRKMVAPIRVRNLDTVHVNLFIKDYTAKWACRPMPSVILLRLSQCALGNDRDWSATAGPTDSKATVVLNFRAGQLEFYVNETCWENDGNPFGATAPTCYTPEDQTLLDTKGFDLSKPGTPNWLKFYDGDDTLSLCYGARLAGAPLGIGPAINGAVELQFGGTVDLAVQRNQYPRFEAYQAGRAQELLLLNQSKSGLYGLWDSISEQNHGAFQRDKAC